MLNVFEDNAVIKNVENQGKLSQGGIVPFCVAKAVKGLYSKPKASLGYGDIWNKLNAHGKSMYDFPKLHPVHYPVPCNLVPFSNVKQFCVCGSENLWFHYYIDDRKKVMI